ncbi:MAG: LON peptidase substrate-binding domain-containing protein [Chitinophagales bacterium]
MKTYPLPLFPLNLVVFPDEKLKLHVFEPRYKQMMKECQEQKKTFGIPVYVDGKVKEYGTEMQLIAIEKVYSGGEMDIVTKGIRAFSLSSFTKKAPNKLYAFGEVAFRQNIDDGDSSLTLQIREQLLALYEVLKVDQTPKHGFSSFEVAHNIGFSIEQEYELLQITKESERQIKILKHLQEIVPVIVETEKIKKKVQMNGYFRNFNILDL